MDATGKKKTTGYRPLTRLNSTAKLAPIELLKQYEKAPGGEQLSAILEAPSLHVTTEVSMVPVSITEPVAIRKAKTVKATVKPPPTPMGTVSDATSRGSRFRAAADVAYPDPKQEGAYEDVTVYEGELLRLEEKRMDLISKKEADPILEAYEQSQKDSEEKGHYILDTTVFIPTTRKAFYPFINETYAETFGLPAHDPDEVLDPTACEKLMKAGQTSVEAFLYQKFVKEYIRQASPYRGILVYHGLGSGKTCTAIAASEALYGVANKKIVVMTPFSLRPNFIREITFCGFRHFSTMNYWVQYPLVKRRLQRDDMGKLVEKFTTHKHVDLYARFVLSLSDTYMAKLYANKLPLWIPDFTKVANFNDESQITPAQRDQIRAQINDSINNRITFINYNGVRKEQLKAWACERKTTGKTIFDDAVIVIDEIHNLIRLMQGSMIPFLQEKEGAKRKRKIPAEPIQPGPWHPALCNQSLNYNRAFLFYRLLVGAKNSKIVGLSGTPIINFPEELAILSNVLGGYIDVFEVLISGADSKKVADLTKIMNADLRTDLVIISPVQGGYNVFCSIFQEGYVKVLDKDDAFQGVKHDAEAQETIQAIFERIKVATTEAVSGVTFGIPKYAAYPRLPPDEETFRGTFVDVMTQSIKNELLLKKRLTGLISYYRGSKQDFMPKVVDDIVDKCEMSEYMLSKYVEARKSEIDQEKTKKGEPDDLFAIVEMFSKSKNPSSYRFRSRAICNFVFPKSIERPFPDTVDDIETKPIEDMDLIERQTAILEDTVDEERRVIEADIEADITTAKLVEEDDIKTELAESEDAVEEAVIGQTKERALTYQEMIQRAMGQLSEQKELFLKLDADLPEKKLSYYSPKLDKIIRRVGDSPGSALVYSQFKTVEGLGVLGIALEANGYEELRTEGLSADAQSLTPSAEASIRKGPAVVNRYITFSGEGTKEQRATALNIFNGNFKALPKKIADVFAETDAAIIDKTKTYEALGNRHGEICKVIAITGAGAEGISLKGVRQVHIMEPYWNMVRLDQVKGRAIRICSHADLPVDERNVSIYTYVTYFTQAQIRGPAAGSASGQVDYTILTADRNETSDEKVFNVSMRKQKINEGLLKIMKEASVDCLMNAPDNENDLSCFITEDTDKTKPMFLPDLKADRVETDADRTPVLDTIRSIADETGRSMPTKATRTVQKVTIDSDEGSIEYTIKLKDESKREYYFFNLKDILQKLALGYFSRDPISGEFADLVAYDVPLKM